MDIKLTITALPNAPLQAAAETILAEHGENFDAARGDFTVKVRDGVAIEIVAKDVSRGDMEMLVRDIESMYDEVSYHASSSTDGGKHWFSIDLDEDD